MALHYLPALGWYTNLIKYPTVRLENCEHFVKASGRNRCEITTAQGKQILSIPLSGGRNQRCLVSELTIDNSKNWQKQHWNAIKTAYGKAPYYDDYSPWLAPFYENTYEKLWDFNFELLQTIHKLLRLDTLYRVTDIFVIPGDHAVIDLRYEGLQTALPSRWIPYYQPFAERHGFLENLSILDLLFNVGPEARNYLAKCMYPDTKP